MTPIPASRDHDLRWSHDLALQIRRRIIWSACALGIAVLLAVATSAQRFTFATVLLTVFLLQALAQEIVRRHVVYVSSVLIFSTATFVADLGLGLGLMYLASGGWWVGTALLGSVVLRAGTVLPRAASLFVLAASIGMHALLLLAQSIGPLHPASWFDLPSLRGNAPLVATLIVVNAVAQAAFWNLSRFQVRRVRLSRQRFQQVFEAAPISMFTLDASARVRSANPAALDMSGFNLAQVTGHGLMRFIPSDDRPRTVEAFRAALAGSVTPLSHRFRRADGQWRWVSVTYAPVVTADDQLEVLTIARDITHEKLAADERAQLERDLAESQRMQLVGRLVSGVAHELNNPLAAVLTFTEQLLRDASNEDDAQALRIVHDQALRARAIVRDLLQVARNRSERPRTPVRLEGLVQRAVESLSGLLETASVTVRVQVESPIPALRVEETGIVQVLVNLLRNAIQVSPPGAVVDIKLRDESTWVAIEVADTGPGISESVMPLLFEPFFTTKQPGQGTGLGLAVSQGIVEQHEGTLVAENGESGSGIGARFTVRLPNCLETAEFSTPSVLSQDVFPVATKVPDETTAISGAKNVAERADSLAPDQRPTVLVVDDEEAIRLALTRWLTRRHWIVETCANGADALALLRQPNASARYEAIICDLKMPGVSGVELYRQLQIEQPLLLERLVLVTGDVASTDVAQFLETVHCPVLEKPFELQLLDDTLSKVRVAVV